MFRRKVQKVKLSLGLGLVSGNVVLDGKTKLLTPLVPAQCQLTA